MPPSDAYVKSFLYFLYTLIKLDYTKALSDPATSLARIEFVSSGGQESQCIPLSSLKILWHCCSLGVGMKKDLYED